MNTKIFINFLLGMILINTLVQQACADEDYDSIVNQLSTKQPTYSVDPLESVKFHVSAGISNSTFNITPKNYSRIQGVNRGVQAAFGIDLFSDNWLSEAAIRSFGDSQIDENRVNLREFDLKLLYHTLFSQYWGIRMGGGLASRYMKLSSPTINTTYVTPASILAMGFESVISKNVSLTADISTRNSMVEESADQSSLDVTFRIDGHF